MVKFVDFLPHFNSFGIADSEWKKMTDDCLPLLLLNPDGYENFDFALPNNAPTIGILLGREKDAYTIGKNYVEAVVSAGGKPLFLDYENHLLQMTLCDALLLPGGKFDTPDWYYTDAKVSPTGEYPCLRAKAYAECLDFALTTGMPVLGICAGMQVIAAESGLKLFRSQSCYETPLYHQSDKMTAHHVDLMEGTSFREMMDNCWRIPVNSRHGEMVAPIRVQRELLGLKPGEKLALDVYGLATDGILEAVGDMAKGILAVQWHPEDLAVAGDALQQRIFAWFVEKARDFRKNH